MTHAKDVLLDQLLANANDPSWYIPFIEAVDGVSENEAFWKPDSTSHSIAEIVQHLVYWNETWQQRYKLSNVNAIPPVKNNDHTFFVTEEQSFQDLKGQLLKTLLQWQELLDDKHLESTVTGFPVEAKWWHIISNATTHNAYHIGQIAYIQKMIKQNRK
ncbi:DinB family protein [Sutcliffiella rhizosphaerae]|uniref:DinB-like domain-containing protein n=1 Tax=Sutcliffiella rhizosphaerae TaxID=2880967 RepID=A0ABM8YNY4_9BACI|nr:DinB family protein [Sutcliffiella rhizosphaerae]CAG9621592.1 hypothetical protein BACCIP111883_02365 [Sutcliffiella rhizosphaerae]